MSRDWQIFTGRHFQNGHHNTAKIQHCPISSKFDMWVDNDVPNWFPTLTNFYQLPFSKWPPQYRKNSTLSDYHQNLICGSIMMSRHWKISTGLHFQNGHHNTAKIQHCPISSIFDMWVDNDVPNWFPTLKNFYQSPFSKWPP
jgi:hypothetical protein